MSYLMAMLKLPGYQEIVTEDGSLSLFSERFQEGCHSLSGAKEETLTHYLQGCRIQEKLENAEEISVLEVGFGTGLGFEMTKQFSRKADKTLRFFSLEIDEELVKWSLENLKLEFQITEVSSFKVYQSLSVKTDLIILVGNARTTLPAFLKDSPIRFDAIYQDAFSPKRNPVLWTTEWFTLLKEYSRPDVILSTYSASNSIRKSLSEAGWMIRKGEAFGPKRASTRALLEGGSDEEILAQMSRSPAEAIRDSQLPKELFL